MVSPPDRDLKRRSSAPSPLPATEKVVPATWEEEELAAYEPKRAKFVEETRQAAAKAALLARQLPHQWKALREIVVHFEAAKKKVTFSGKAFGYDREYELIVPTFGAADTTVWYNQSTLATDQPDDIAKTMLGVFLRAEES